MGMWLWAWLVGAVVGSASGLAANLAPLGWLVGKWRSEYSGKVFWPTVPTMTYGEELVVMEAPVARSSGIAFLNFRSLPSFPSSS